jgi:hypothetical protein
MNENNIAIAKIATSLNLFFILFRISVLLLKILDRKRVAVVSAHFSTGGLALLG